MAVLHSYERAAELFGAGVLDPRLFITDRLPLQRYAEALDTLVASIGVVFDLRPVVRGVVM
jgi:hypothetical protein